MFGSERTDGGCMNESRLESKASQVIASLGVHISGFSGMRMDRCWYVYAGIARSMAEVQVGYEMP